MPQTNIHRAFDEELRHAAKRMHAWNAAQDQPRRLRACVANWREAGAIRAFLDALHRETSPPPTTPLAEWIQWGRSYADVLDPLSPAGLTRLQRNAENLAALSHAAAEPTEEEWEWYGNGFMDRHLEELEEASEWPEEA